MALQVWLPLKGDLNNQGLSNIIFTNTGVSIDDNGKIGKCYHFNADQYIKESTYDWTNFNTSEFSLCCWYKEPSPVASGNSQIICIGTSSGWNNIRIGLLRRTSNGYPMFSVSDGSTAIQYNFTASTFTLDTWNHIAVTYNNGELKMYLNGTLNKTSATTIVPVLNNSQHLGIGAASNGAEKLTGFLNDVRIYDHALSAKEVEEISKGLILHYKLDDKYSESTINLCDGSTNGTQASAVSPGSWGGHKYYTILVDKEISDPIPNNKKSVMTIDFSTSYGSGGGAAVYPPRSFTVEPSTTYAYSRYIKPSDNFTYTHANFLYRYEYAEDGTMLKQGGVFNKNNIEYIGNGWYRCCGTFTTQSTTAYLTLPFYTYPGKSMTYELSGLQLEKKDHMTPYVEYERMGIIYDSSGYQNNGKIFTPLTLSSETTRYICSTYFNGETSAIKVPYTDIASTDDIFTLNLWFKKDDLGSKNYETLFGGPSGFEMDTRAGSATALTLYMASTRGSNFAQFNFGEWYMITMVNNGTNELYYVNAELKKTIDKKPMPAGNYYIGAWATETRQNYKGLISDFRIYKTALTEKQIKELYNTSATVDKNGNIYTREAIEL